RAFGDPTKPIGPIYQQAESERLSQEKGWVFKPDGDSFRRVVPSPLPKRIFGLEPVQWLLERGAVGICAGGGGIPVMYTDAAGPAGRPVVGVEAVIDKDLASALLAKDLGADALAIVTDVDAVYDGWGTPEQRAIRRATPAALAQSEFAAGSMGPKVRAACSFVEQTGGIAAIGSISGTPALLSGDAGATVTRDADGLRLPPGAGGAGGGSEERDDEGTPGRGPRCSERRRRGRSRAAHGRLAQPRRRRGLRAARRRSAGGARHGRGGEAPRQGRPEQARRSEAGAGLARVPAPVPRPDAARPARRGDREHGCAAGVQHGHRHHRADGPQRDPRSQPGRQGGGKRRSAAEDARDQGARAAQRRRGRRAERGARAG